MNSVDKLARNITSELRERNAECLAASLRIVLDTNTVLRGLVAEASAATKVLRAAERRRFFHF